MASFSGNLLTTRLKALSSAMSLAVWYVGDSRYFPRETPGVFLVCMYLDPVYASCSVQYGTVRYAVVQLIVPTEVMQGGRDFEVNGGPKEMVPCTSFLTAHLALQLVLCRCLLLC